MLCLQSVCSRQNICRFQKHKNFETVGKLRTRWIIRKYDLAKLVYGPRGTHKPGLFFLTFCLSVFSFICLSVSLSLGIMYTGLFNLCLSLSKYMLNIFNSSPFISIITDQFRVGSEVYSIPLRRQKAFAWDNELLKVL